MGLVSLGYGIYALVTDDMSLLTDLIETGTDVRLTVSDRQAETILVSVSAVVVVVTFLGCCGALKV